ncbi:copper homeostasis protein CutC [Sunxiuqinia elliptica]|uniref:PF03932 family protein CutC n=1 Tax=Sunxiuqinia elliptica TaxID=655355 RepID=A0A4R6HBE6_9BACT|nr:copper homeostasis protein CutC [Sunxiuqinia elliptica]TDO05278.1 copper homeostasis protein [Sunxiuqinia elliptica]TDO64827.1 copper homeostasis protein [Sunxiuqinia elliptica]
MIKEACIENFTQALAAQQAGADRVELCENLAVGGTTPSYGTIKACMEKLEIPPFVMIRPRGGDFTYSAEELEIMQEDIDRCKELGVPAVVFGLLTADGEIDVANTRMLVERARPMQVTFHKAFDELANPLAGIDTLVELGVDRLLTSGTKATAKEGTEILNQLIERANGKLTIVAAGKVMRDNLADLSQAIQTTEFHGKAIV